MNEPIASQKETVEQHIPKKKFHFGYTEAVLIGLILAILGNLFFVKTYVVPSQSMQPTLQVKDYMVSIPLLDNQALPEHGEIIVFHPPASWDESPNAVWVKRVIGTAGDVVESHNGNIIVNGETLQEPYLKNGNQTDEEWSYTVPEGSVFVLGDNRQNSYDSRYHDEHFIPVENIIGQPMFVIWPFNHIQNLD